VSALNGMNEVDKANGIVNKREVIEVAALDPLMQRRAPAAEPAPEPEPQVAKQGRDDVKLNPGTENEEEINDAAADTRKNAKGAKLDADANAGSDYDAMPVEDGGEEVPAPDSAGGNTRFSIPNSAYRPARILVNPRCPTTYAGVSHTKLARDLFGEGDSVDMEPAQGGKYILEDWEGAPESFVCQEQR
jgi:hypothetical protein